ncbi:MAG: UDP-N-acetylglucosamine 2-epimerase (non-hydrolyzing) [candidate division WOR-3 bacterium]
MRVLFSFGTRPEAIKLAPVIKDMEKRGGFDVRVLVTAQHRRMLDQVLELFGIRPDYDLDVMKSDQSLSDVVVRSLLRLEQVIQQCRPDMLLVQGDTTSAFASALAAYYQQIPVGHVEAGLRTGDKFAPFPEEMNRRLIGALAELHFAPTRWARNNLVREGVPARAIHVTGNTVVDALLMTLKLSRDWRVPVLEGVPSDRKVILVTGHRRESFGPGLERICRALRAIARRNRDVEIVYPVHLNPQVRGTVQKILSGTERVHLIEPLDYLTFVHLMERAYIILTDSGGIQEEAPTLHKPVLVLREKTERPEAVAAGTARLVGTAVTDIVAETERLLHSPTAYQRMSAAHNPFGDGKAAQRIGKIVAGYCRQKMD